jgi:hypothetical protein
LEEKVVISETVNQIGQPALRFVVIVVIVFFVVQRQDKHRLVPVHLLLPNREHLNVKPFGCLLG